MSVQPRVDWRIQEEDDEGTITLSLANVGFGPAVVTNVTFLIDGEAIPATSLDACKDVAARIGRADEDAWDSSCFVGTREYVLRAGDTVTLFARSPAPGHEAEDHSAALVNYHRIGARAHYCPFYEDC